MPATLFKTPTQVLSCEYCEYFEEYLCAAASERTENVLLVF